jgi:hypothetical protein
VTSLAILFARTLGMNHAFQDRGGVANEGKVLKRLLLLVSQLYVYHLIYLIECDK